MPDYAQLQLLASQGNKTAQSMSSTLQANASKSATQVAAAVNNVKDASKIASVTSQANVERSSPFQLNAAQLVEKSTQDVVNSLTNQANGYVLLAQQQPSIASSPDYLKSVMLNLSGLTLVQKGLDDTKSSQMCVADGQKTAQEKSANTLIFNTEEALKEIEANAKKNAELNKSVSFVDLAPDISLLDRIYNSVTTIADNPEKLNEYVKNPSVFIQDIANFQNQLSYSDELQNKAAKILMDVLLPADSIYTALTSTDAQSGKAKTPDVFNVIDTLAVVPFLAPLKEVKAASGAIKVAENVALKEGIEAFATISAKYGDTVAKGIIDDVAKANADSIFKAAATAAETKADDIAKLVKQILEVDVLNKPGLITEIKDTALKALGKVPSVTDVSVFSEYALRRPVAAANVIRANFDDFLRMGVEDRAAILTAISKTPDGKTALKLLADGADAAVGKVLPTATAAAIKKSGGMDLLAKGLALAIGATSMAHVAAIFQVPDTLFGVDNLIKSGDLKNARKSLDAQKAVVDAVGAIIDATPWWPILGPISTSFIDSTRAKIEISEELLSEAEKKAGTVIKADDLIYKNKGSETTTFGKTFGKLQVESDPDGAWVFLNNVLMTQDTGASLNVTPMIISDLAEGDYTIEVRKRGYNSMSEVVKVVGGDIKVRRFTLTPMTSEATIEEGKKVFVLIQSTPLNGARVIIDGLSTYATTPHLAQLTIGTHVIEVEMTDYNKGITTITLTEEDDEVSVTVPMTLQTFAPIEPTAKPTLPITPTTAEITTETAAAQTGWSYTITSNPPGASIYVNGNNTFKKTPAEIILKGNSDYIIMVDLFGYKPAFAQVHTDPI